MNDIDPSRFKIILNDRVLVDLPIVVVGWILFFVLFTVFLYLIVRT